MSLDTALEPALADLDWHEYACAWGDCPNTASWWLICLHCRRHTPWCNPCRLREVIRISDGVYPSIGCSGCFDRTSCEDAWNLFAFVPIGVS